MDRMIRIEATDNDRRLAYRTIPSILCIHANCLITEELEP